VALGLETIDGQIREVCDVALTKMAVSNGVTLQCFTPLLDGDEYKGLLPKQVEKEMSWKR